MVAYARTCILLLATVALITNAKPQTETAHQFQLEIDMWQLQLDQIDRQLAEMQRKR